MMVCIIDEIRSNLGVFHLSLQFTWTTMSFKFIPYDCFLIGQDHWYGGAEILNDRWTIEKGPTRMQHYLSNDIGMVRDGWGNVLERYWLSSKGVSITVDDEVPLNVGVNISRLCFKGDYFNTTYQNPDHLRPYLKYRVCLSQDVLAAHLFIASRQFTPAKQIPNKLLFEKPVWSSWAQFHKAINQEKVIQYAKDIKRHGFVGCQIEIDDGYDKHYGDFSFDSDKFPSPLDMSRKVGALGFNLTTWVTPFTNKDSLDYKEGLDKGYFVKSASDDVTVKWWRGRGAVLDVTNPEAITWMKKRLHRLISQGVTAFKFDAGEANFMPDLFLTKNKITNSNHYGRLYASHMHNLTLNRLIEVRVGYHSQNLPVMVRMMDKDTCWGYARGIQTVIPTALLFGILGYPFVLPDMVGGNGWIGNKTTLPSKELYLRWVAVNALLPFVQFSIPPWTLDEETVRMTHDLLHIRKMHLPTILRAATESAQTAHPIVRPLWWIDPQNSDTFDIDSEFLVGDDLLVAPILHKGQLSRDIYLPRGTWKDLKHEEVYLGRQYVKNYKAALNELPVFRRMSSKGEFASPSTSAS